MSTKKDKKYTKEIFVDLVLLFQQKSYFINKFRLFQQSRCGI